MGKKKFLLLAVMVFFLLAPSVFGLTACFACSTNNCDDSIDGGKNVLKAGVTYCRSSVAAKDGVFGNGIHEWYCNGLSQYCYEDIPCPSGYQPVFVSAYNAYECKLIPDTPPTVGTCTVNETQLYTGNGYETQDATCTFTDANGYAQIEYGEIRINWLTTCASATDSNCGGYFRWTQSGNTFTKYSDYGSSWTTIDTGSSSCTGTTCTVHFRWHYPTTWVRTGNDIAMSVKATNLGSAQAFTMPNLDRFDTTGCSANGGACTLPGQCCSLNCKADYDGVGSFCADATQCVDNAILYNNGANALVCPDASNRRYCNSGVWAIASCGTDVCSGGCPGCTFTDYLCSAGACGSSSLDCDGAQARCDACRTPGFWSIGGEVAAAACCGDDTGENKKTRACTSGCTSDGTDDACCSGSTDCVYSSVCYDTGVCNGAIKCIGGSWVNHCANGLQDCGETGMDCGGADCGVCCSTNGMSCTLPTQCCSLNCKADYDGAGSFCADATQCVDNAILYNNGVNALVCPDASSRRYCNSGVWAIASCGTDACSGGCTSGCTFTDYLCSAGACGSSSLDCDGAQARCDACKTTGFWSIGGEVAGTACCGDDLFEFKKTRTCTSGCATNSSDDACCNESTDCVYSSVCYSDGACNGAIKCTGGSWVSHCINGIQDCTETAVDCGGADCKFVDGTACSTGAQCCSNYCDSDSLGANFDPYKDDGWCFTPTPSNPALENQDFKCEISSSQGSPACDEFQNSTDCSYLDGRHFWCNQSCELQNRDANPEACSAVGAYCSGAFPWLKGGESNVNLAEGVWEYTDKTAFECCGDDTSENPMNRNSSCTEPGCTANDEPNLGDSFVDRVCCNSSLDCVYDGNCYASDNEGGAPQTFGGDNPATPSVFCENGVWYDCDNSQGGCEEADGRCGISNAWLLSGESGVGEYNAIDKPECCGDDAVEFLINSSGFQGHAPGDVSCCDSQFDCVLGSVCGKSDSNGGEELSCYDGIDNDCDGATDFCDGRFQLPCTRYDGLDDGCTVTISGFISNTSFDPIGGAQIFALTPFQYKDFSRVINFSNYTNASGHYSIAVYANSTYEIVVKKKGNHLFSEPSEHLDIGDSWELNMTLAKDVGCQPECSMHDDSLCHMECSGINGCAFYSPLAAVVCSMRPKGAILEFNSTHNIECCSGVPFRKLVSSKPNVEVRNSTYVNRNTNLVIYRGKPIQMIVVTYS